MCACLRRWLTTHGDSCPHTFVSTHFHGALSHLPKSPLLSSQVVPQWSDRGACVRACDMFNIVWERCKFF